MFQKCKKCDTVDNIKTSSIGWLNIGNTYCIHEWEPAKLMQNSNNNLRYLLEHTTELRKTFSNEFNNTEDLINYLGNQTFSINKIYNIHIYYGEPPLYNHDIIIQKVLIVKHKKCFFSKSRKILVTIHFSKINFPLKLFLYIQNN